ncbi:glutaminyl-tRNA synthase (glutamine-hydrolyzing) subunit A [Candidatus Giovannonibacteria bacterium RIFCSPHIGHO2_02_FULL_46_20]|uniref:Glutamyl-tRNA(Gln) amidotransferase subunit A n=1 Tax=Candidatus Giovannonibacteria bacterium RIFCSPHIGHO2_02_FULL_46_20 TaxID=1798338 RepID=A0A1F5WFP5_9BACT|nr:MAG: glutaminyl-tRNA synthase (glutamine-hydrolyzing) subunit A [Candidatus Giovannonibacteria bacterium RIFCSPHIGHO2_02_FULL_46_20]
MTILEFHEKLKSGKVSAREATNGYLEEIKTHNKRLGAYLEVHTDDAFSDAQRIDERVREGEAPGVLWGIPLAIKDNILIRGKRASAASRILENYVASYDATVIAKLKKSGAIFLGRTNMDEFAMGSSTENSAYFPARNPYHTDYVPGGSSGGSAVAVKAGLALAALGSDTGGSIRQPAAFCGVVGLKPTYGSVSRSGLIAMASSLDQVGVFAQTAEDAKILFEAICGHDPLDSTSVDYKLPTIKPVRTIGIPKEYFADGLDPRIKSVIEATIKKLGKNYDVVEIHLPHTKYAIACYYIIVFAEVSSNMARFDGIRYGVRTAGTDLYAAYRASRGSGIGKEVRRRIILGTYVLSHGYYDAYYAHAQKVRHCIAEDFKKAFSTVDVIVGPTTPTLPFKLGEKVEDPLAMYLSDMYTIPANLVGIPAVSLPAGTAHHDGVEFPVGIQLMAPHFREDRLFEVGKAIEQELL